MEIPRDFRPLDPLGRRRASEPAPASGREDASPPEGTRVDGFAAPESAEVKRYVQMLQAHSADPERLARLRERIADGSYTAEPEELADRLLDRVDPPQPG